MHIINALPNNRNLIGKLESQQEVEFSAILQLPINFSDLNYQLFLVLLLQINIWALLQKKYPELLPRMSCWPSVRVLQSNQTEWRHQGFPLMNPQNHFPVLQALHHAHPAGQNSKILVLQQSLLNCTYWLIHMAYESSNMANLYLKLSKINVCYWQKNWLNVVFICK